MKFRATFFVVLVAGFFAAFGVAQACEGYKDQSTEDLKAYRDKLAQADADPLDKFFAFQELYCSSNPVLRAYAAKAGLESNADPIIRQQIMLILLLDMKHVVVEITAAKNSTANDKQFIAKNDGKIDYISRYASESDGCISIYRDDECLVNYAFFIKGDTVKLYNDRLYGEFVLSDSNDLSGYIRTYNGDGYGRIPAVIRLN